MPVTTPVISMGSIVVLLMVGGSGGLGIKRHACKKIKTQK